MVTNSMMIQEAYCSFFSVRKESWVRSVHRATVLTHDISAGVKSTVTHHCTFTAICVCVCGWLGVCMCGCVWVGLGVCDVISRLKQYMLLYHAAPPPTERKLSYKVIRKYKRKTSYIYIYIYSPTRYTM